MQARLFSKIKGRPLLGSRLQGVNGSLCLVSQFLVCLSMLG